MRGRVIGGVGAASLLVLALPLAVGTPSANAKVTPGIYNLIASADTASFEWNVEKAPIVAPQVAFFSPGSTGIALTSLGDSTGFAGAPFFGATVEGAGGLANGLGSGRIPPLPPTLPGYVTSSHPSSPGSSASNGPYTLKTESTERASSAVAGIAAVSGQPSFLASSATSNGSFDEATGSLTATAESISQPFEIGSVVTVGQVRSLAQMVLDENGKLTPSSAFDVGTITIAGVKFGLTEQGLQVSDKSATPVSIQQLNEALTPSGISVKFLSGSTTPTSVVADGLQFTIAYTVPVEGATAEIITLGHASAHLEYTLVKDTLTTGLTDTIGGATPPLAGTGADLAGAGLLPSTTGAVPTGVVPTGGVALAPQVISNAAGQTLLPSDLRMDVGNWYLVLLVAGLSLTLGSRFVGLLGIRRPSP